MTYQEEKQVLIRICSNIWKQSLVGGNGIFVFKDDNLIKPLLSRIDFLQDKTK